MISITKTMKRGTEWNKRKKKVQKESKKHRLTGERHSPGTSHRLPSLPVPKQLQVLWSKCSTQDSILEHMLVRRLSQLCVRTLMLGKTRRSRKERKGQASRGKVIKKNESWAENTKGGSGIRGTQRRKKNVEQMREKDGREDKKGEKSRQKREEYDATG